MLHTKPVLDKVYAVSAVYHVAKLKTQYTFFTAVVVCSMLLRHNNLIPKFIIPARPSEECTGAGFVPDILGIS